MIRCPDNQINASFIDISRIKWLVFLLWSSFFRTTSTVASSEAPADYQPAPGQNLCLELQQNRSWIKGLGKNPQKSELIHWRQCLLSGGTEACSHEWHVDMASGKTLKKRNACLHAVRQAVGKKIACLNGLRSEGVNFFWVV